MKISLAKSAEALRWREYYQLLPLWAECRSMLRAGLAVVVKSGVRHLHALMEAHADVNKHSNRR
jgi:hypothetical protein